MWACPFRPRQYELKTAKQQAQQTELHLDVAYTAVHAAANQAKVLKEGIFYLQEKVLDDDYGFWKGEDEQACPALCAPRLCFWGPRCRFLRVFLCVHGGAPQRSGWRWG